MCNRKWPRQLPNWPLIESHGSIMNFLEVCGICSQTTIVNSPQILTVFRKPPLRQWRWQSHIGCDENCRLSVPWGRDWIVVKTMAAILLSYTKNAELLWGYFFMVERVASSELSYSKLQTTYSERDWLNNHGKKAEILTLRQSNIHYLCGLLSTRCLVCHRLPQIEPLYTHVIFCLLPLGSDPHGPHVWGSQIAFVCMLFGVLLSFLRPHRSKIIRALSLATWHSSHDGEGDCSKELVTELMDDF